MIKVGFSIVFRHFDERNEEAILCRFDCINNTMWSMFTFLLMGLPRCPKEGLLAMTPPNRPRL